MVVFAGTMGVASTDAKAAVVQKQKISMTAHGKIFIVPILIPTLALPYLQ
jgi:hypothetical protein